MVPQLWQRLLWLLLLMMLNALCILPLASGMDAVAVFYGVAIVFLVPAVVARATRLGWGFLLQFLILIGIISSPSGRGLGVLPLFGLTPDAPIQGLAAGGALALVLRYDFRSRSD